MHGVRKKHNDILSAKLANLTSEIQCLLTLAPEVGKVAYFLGGVDRDQTNVLIHRPTGRRLVANPIFDLSSDDDHPSLLVGYQYPTRFSHFKKPPKTLQTTRKRVEMKTYPRVG